MFKAILSIFLLSAFTLAIACSSSAAPHADVKEIWWTKTGGGDSTLMDIYLAKDGTFKTNTSQTGTYKLTEGEIAMKSPGPGGEYTYEIVSASSTELKVKFLGHEYTFTPRKE